MKTKEFIKRVKELGYNCFTNESYIFITRGYRLIATIALHEMYSIKLCTGDYKLCELCVKYTRTRIEEREEEKKFYLQKMKSFYEDGFDEECMFLKGYTNIRRFFLSNSAQNRFYKTQYTQKEIDKIKEEQHTDLSEFKQIPVEEVE